MWVRHQQVNRPACDHQGPRWWGETRGRHARQDRRVQLPGVRAVAGTAQAIPLPSGTLDAVVCAQAFHWFATRDALDEFHRVLRPGGKLRPGVERSR